MLAVLDCHFPNDFDNIRTMGGLGSGRHIGTSRSTVESCLALDINRWNCERLLYAGARFGWHWTCRDGRVASITVAVGDRHVQLMYRYGARDGEWEDVDQRVPLTWTDCHLGGRRPWFVCSVYRNGVYCGRRVGKLYGGGKYFACRRCYDLAYQSQRENAHGRAILRLQKLRVRLGGTAVLGDPLPNKPKGMHWRTYARLMREAERLDAQALSGTIQVVDALRERVARHSQKQKRGGSQPPHRTR